MSRTRTPRCELCSGSSPALGSIKLRRARLLQLAASAAWGRPFYNRESAIFNRFSQHLPAFTCASVTARLFIQAYDRLSEFVSLLFKDAVHNSNYIASNDWMTANNELERKWKLAAPSLPNVGILEVTCRKRGTRVKLEGSQ